MSQRSNNHYVHAVFLLTILHSPHQMLMSASSRPLPVIRSQNAPTLMVASIVNAVLVSVVMDSSAPVSYDSSWVKECINQLISLIRLTLCDN